MKQVARQFKDPDEIRTSQQPSAKDSRTGYWTQFDRIEMDAQFRLAVTTAVEAGLETCTTSPSTHFGTKCPIANYQRDD
jgi:hypothetical protein